MCIVLRVLPFPSLVGHISVLAFKLFVYSMFWIIGFLPRSLQFLYRFKSISVSNSGSSYLRSCLNYSYTRCSGSSVFFFDRCNFCIVLRVFPFPPLVVHISVLVLFICTMFLIIDYLSSLYFWYRFELIFLFPRILWWFIVSVLVPIKHTSLVSPLSFFITNSYRI